MRRLGSKIRNRSDFGLLYFIQMIDMVLCFNFFLLLFISFLISSISHFFLLYYKSTLFLSIPLSPHYLPSLLHTSS